MNVPIDNGLGDRGKIVNFRLIGLILPINYFADSVTISKSDTIYGNWGQAGFCKHASKTNSLVFAELTDPSALFPINRAKSSFEIS
jgi:hypothetical protein